MSAPSPARPLNLPLLLLSLLLAGPAVASPPGSETRPWSEAYPGVRQDLEAGRPLVVEVLVALCSNRQIWCGSKWAGQPASPRTNIYWGAVFGARTHFSRKDAGWTLVDQRQLDEVVLEQAVFRRDVEAANWQLERPGPIEQIVVLRAVHGNAIDQAVRQLYQRAARGHTVRWFENGRERRHRVHAIGYAGHNRLLDGIDFPPPLPSARASDAPIPAFVLACISEKYFAQHLSAVGSQPLVMTRSYMAPEGYVVDAVVRGLGENASASGLRQRAVQAYSKWQRLSVGEADVIFARR